MCEYENRAKRLKLQMKTAAMEKMNVDSEKKSNFSSISPSNGAIVRGNSNAKCDVKKLVIKNFRSKFFSSFFVSIIFVHWSRTMREMFQ